MKKYFFYLLFIHIIALSGCNKEGTISTNDGAYALRINELRDKIIGKWMIYSKRSYSVPRVMNESDGYYLIFKQDSMCDFIRHDTLHESYQYEIKWDYFPEFKDSFNIVRFLGWVRVECDPDDTTTKIINYSDFAIQYLGFTNDSLSFFGLEDWFFCSKYRK